MTRVNVQGVQARLSELLARLRLLLDSHALLWWLEDDRRLSGDTIEAIAFSRSTSRLIMRSTRHDSRAITVTRSTDCS